VTDKTRVNANRLAKLHILVLLDQGALKGPNVCPDNSDRFVVEALHRIVRSCTLHMYFSPDMLLRVIRRVQPDIVFNLTQHADGDRSKDSHICGLLELLDQPYTGTTARGLMLCRDKALSKVLAKDAGFNVPRFFVVDSKSTRLPQEVKFPCIVKPRFGDASEYVDASSVVANVKQLRSRVALLRQKRIDNVIVEEYIHGREIVVGIAGSRVLRPREVVFGKVDPSSTPVACSRVKWNDRYRERQKIATRYPIISSAQRKKLVQACKKSLVALEMRDYTRLDLKLNNDGEWVFLEANPNPGLSRSPLSWYGTWDSIVYEDLIRGVLMSALKRSNVKRRRCTT
jgi:D-alanine-D-alanine ligase